MILLFFSCLTSLPSTDLPPNFEFSDPEIRIIEWECNLDESTWTFSVETNGWTGNGHVWISKDGEINEKHILYSTGAERDGSADYLNLSLNIVPTWQDAKPNTTTQFRCSDIEELSFLVRVLHPEYTEQSDCRYWGAYVWNEVSSGPECNTALEE